MPTNKSNEKGRLKSFLFYYLFRGDICLKKPKIIFENKAIFICKRHSNQAVSLRSFSLFPSAAPVGCAALRSADTIQPQNKQQLENKQLFFCAASFLFSTRSLPAFGRAYASTIPLHSVPLRKLRSTAFQQYHVCRPLFFQRLLLRTTIGVGSVNTFP